MLERILEVQRSEGADLLDQIVAKSNRSVLLADTLANEQSRTGKAILDAMLNSPGSELESSKETVWGWINGVTYDHESGSDKNRMKSAWFGPNADLKDQAMKLAVEYVNEVRVS